MRTPLTDSEVEVIRENVVRALERLPTHHLFFFLEDLEE